MYYIRSLFGGNGGKVDSESEPAGRSEQTDDFSKQVDPDSEINQTSVNSNLNNDALDPVYSRLLRII